jgi:hypothetical protein
VSAAGTSTGSAGGSSASALALQAALDAAVEKHGAYGGGVLRIASAAGVVWEGATAQPGVDYGLGLFRTSLDVVPGTLVGHDGHGNAFLYHWPERGLVFAGTLNQTNDDWYPHVQSAATAL